MRLTQEEYQALVDRMAKKAKAIEAVKLEPASRPKVSKLEAQFIALWESISTIKLVPEYRFHPARNWRFDFADPGSKVAIEIEGGIYCKSKKSKTTEYNSGGTRVIHTETDNRTGGRHNTGKGFKEDCEKYNAATMLGWKVIRLTEVRRAELEEINNFVRNNQPQNT